MVRPRHKPHKSPKRSTDRRCIPSGGSGRIGHAGDRSRTRRGAPPRRHGHRKGHRLSDGGSFTGGAGAGARAPLVEISEHDDTTVADLAGAVDGVAGPAARLVVDLTRTTWMDTSIVAWILGMEHRLEDGALALVVEPGSRPAKLFEMLRLDRVLPVAR